MIKYNAVYCTISVNYFSAYPYIVSCEAVYFGFATLACALVLLSRWYLHWSHARRCDAQQYGDQCAGRFFWGILVDARRPKHGTVVCLIGVAGAAGIDVGWTFVWELPTAKQA